MNENMKKRIQAVGYISTYNQQQDNIIQFQKDAFNEYCNNGTQMIRLFTDEGVSDGLENRPALAELFLFLESHPNIRRVLVWNLEIITREIYLQEYLKKKIEILNIQLVSLIEPSNDPKRIAFRDVTEAIEKSERSFIAMRLKEGRRLKAKKGGYAGGGVPFGYVSSDKELSVNDLEAKTVREIFKMRVNANCSYGQIAKVLNSRNISTSHGRRWYAGTIFYMFHNPRYKGVLEYAGEKVKRENLALVK